MPQVSRLISALHGASHQRDASRLSPIDPPARSSLSVWAAIAFVSCAAPARLDSPAPLPGHIQAGGPAPVSAPALVSVDRGPIPASEGPVSLTPPTQSTTEPSPELCADVESTLVLSEPGIRRLFSVHGYLARYLRLTRTIGPETLTHCITVAWPPAQVNSRGDPCGVARSIDDAWFRAIRNTLARVPFSHVRALRRVVIDNHPTQHGIAAFNRNSVEDGRDGHTIWLHEHLFVSPNHWARGNHGLYWSYHVDQDRKVFDGSPADHDLFSPVLLHELGHLVMYNVINQAVAVFDTPECARTCGDAGNCQALKAAEREASCVTPYCMPFKFQVGTENWAEQYRFHYQSSTTRSLLREAQSNCAALLAEQDASDVEAHRAPWERGLPDISVFRRSLWDSCGGKACKPW